MGWLLQSLVYSVGVGSFLSKERKESIEGRERLKLKQMLKQMPKLISNMKKISCLRLREYFRG